MNNPEGQEQCQVKDQNEDFIDAQKLLGLGAERLSCQVEELAVNSVYGIGDQKNGEIAEIDNAAPLQKIAQQQNIYLASYC
ncbi:MAG: hypothetical protein ACI9SK_001690 [Zhongshania sp.]